MRISKGVEMLELEASLFGRKSVLNLTLLWNENEAVLIDTGMPGQSGQIFEALKELGIPKDHLKTVILTHQDIDHIGSMPEITEALNGKVKVFAHEKDRPYIEGEIPLIKTNTERMSERQSAMPKELYDQAMALFQNLPKAHVDRALEDGEELPFLGGVKVIYTPGHTPGHISLYLKESKTLVTADAMVSVEGTLRGPVEQNTPDMEAAYESLKKFLDYDIDTVICYHGGAVTGNIQGQLQSIIKGVHD
ncbi:MBL fold metallo-hydrolase [Neobacillus terrae]|uniref:MBL fold metallo-hydrolase n=1 Tax=Neobacillus terrae TaxID=3034837 RepID=UPI00140BD983|nr:MBL fold metallo-hydrolase [Neobacillus terrae]NHM33908.1 MBL fold metallo-hydrolase [Neobacillus terrae]